MIDNKKLTKAERNPDKDVVVNIPMFCDLLVSCQALNSVDDSKTGDGHKCQKDNDMN